MRRNISVFIKNAILNWAVFLVALTLTLFLAELAVRIFSPQQLTIQNNRVWMPDSLVGWKKAPLVDEVINTGEGTVAIKTDSFGYRISKNAVGDKNCHHAILFLGDSFVEALQVENEDAFPELLSQKLKQKRGVDYCTVNTGVGGWGPGQYYVQAKLELERRKFDLIVVSIFAGNDFISKFDTLFTPRQPVKVHKLRLPASLAKKEFQLALWRPVKNYLSARSHLFVLLKNSIEYFDPKTNEGEYIQSLFLRTNENNSFWKTTVDACRQIHSIAKGKNTPVVFCLLPTNFQVHEDIFINYLNASGIDIQSVDLEQPNKVFIRLMKENNLFAMDPLYYLRKDGQSGSPFGEVDRHFNKKGHRSVAEFIFPVVDSILGQ